MDRCRVSGEASERQRGLFLRFEAPQRQVSGSVRCSKNMANRIKSQASDTSKSPGIIVNQRVRLPELIKGDVGRILFCGLLRYSSKICDR